MACGVWQEPSAIVVVLVLVLDWSARCVQSVRYYPRVGIEGDFKRVGCGLSRTRTTTRTRTIYEGAYSSNLYETKVRRIFFEETKKSLAKTALLFQSIYNYCRPAPLYPPRTTQGLDTR